MTWNAAEPEQHTCGEMSISKVVDDLLALRSLAGSRATEDERDTGLLGHPDVDLDKSSLLPFTKSMTRLSSLED